MGNRLVRAEGDGTVCSVPAFINDVLAFCDWNERISTFSLISKKWLLHTRSEAYWRYLCLCLINDCALYIPATLPRGESWKRLFLDFYPFRNTWILGGIDTEVNKKVRFKVNVFARFKPMPPDESENNEIDSPVITLPLHQRLHLIRLSRKISSNREALKILKNEGSWFGEKWSQIEKEKKAKSAAVAGENDENAENSSTGKETFTPLVASVHNVDPGSGRVMMVAADVGLREFVFDGVLPVKTTQVAVYETVARRLVIDFLNGFNSTILCYGQTGAGKTFTMFGEHSTAVMGKAFSKDGVGIVPRACIEVFDGIKLKQRQGMLNITLSVSYVEIYGDQVTDLLKSGQRCGHSKVAAQGFVLSGAAETPVCCLSDVASLLELGEQHKRRASTAMNDRSSRAHALFILTLSQVCEATGITVCSRLFMADLGGSEQVKKSKVDAGASKRHPLAQRSPTSDPSAASALSLNSESDDHTGDQHREEVYSTGFVKGERMREAVHINLGLLALKKCIEALNNGSSYIPFQDSKLTMLLSTGLGGDCKTSVVICGSMEPKNAGETMAAMRFGERCALVENEARSHASAMAGILAKLEREIAAFEELIVKKERWEEVAVKREDTLAEEGTFEKAVGGVEIQRTTVLVGAEDERRELEKLLRQRAELTGLSRELETLRAENGKLGFGRQYAELYGLGKGYDMELEEGEANQRFQDKVAVDLLPEVIRTKLGGKQWQQVQSNDAKSSLRTKASKKAQKGKLVYSGFSY